MQSLFRPGSPAMKVMTWIADMFKIQFMWTLGTLLGLIIGGIFPATASMFAVHRDIIFKEPGFNYWDKFWQEYRRNFLKANALGIFLIIFSMILVIYFRMTFRIESSVSTIFVFFGYALVVLFGIMSLWIFPVFAHFDLGIFQIFKHALILMVSVPLSTFAMTVLVVFYIWTFERLLILVPFVSIAMLTYGVMYFANVAFKAVAKANEEENN